MIGVASAIGIPNFIEAQGRSKVSRVQAELRSINTGLESYFVDWNKYPQRLEQMTTPIAYITKIFNDPFNTSETYKYLLDSGKNSWKIYSLGPDQTDNEGEITYDPTNGTVSEGDIVREKQ
jgi:type II secretory pathway pseudopilin PulG